jgi:hypothetical protein
VDGGHKSVVTSLGAPETLTRWHRERIAREAATMTVGRLVVSCLVIWFAYAGVVFCWAACGGGYGAQNDWLAWPLCFVGSGIFLWTGFGVGLRVMEMVRLRSLKKALRPSW